MIYTRSIGKRQIALIFFGLLVLFILMAASVEARKHQHIQTATLTYSNTPINAGSFLGRKFDLLVNPTNDVYDAAYAVDPTIQAIDYVCFSAQLFETDDYGLNDTLRLAQFCAQNGYDESTFYLWAENTITISAEGQPRTTYPGQKVRMYGAGHERYALDSRNPHLGEYIWYEIKSELASRGGRAFNGVFEDEAFLLKSSIWGQIAGANTFPFHTTAWVQGTPADVNGWDDHTTISIPEFVEIQDSLIKLKHEVYQWPQKLHDSLEAHNLLFFRNPADYMCWTGEGPYGTPDYQTEGFLGLGYCFGEFVWLRPAGGASLLTTMKYLDWTKTYADAGTTTLFWVYIMWSDANALGGGLDGWRRCQYERLCYYYMAADPQLTWYFQTSNEIGMGPNGWNNASDSTYRYSPVIEVDIGQPIPGNSFEVYQTGTDGAGQSYSIRARDFTNSKVLWRFRNGSNYGSASAVNVNLDGYYYPVDAYGNISSDSTNVVSLRNAEGMIVLRSADPVIDTIPPATINDFRTGSGN